MPDAPAFAPDLLQLQVAVLRAQHARHNAADGPHEVFAAAMEDERQAVLALHRHPGKLAGQAGGKWNELVEAARRVIAEDAGGEAGRA